MNTLVIPPSPNWYETAILACAPDNSLIYGARNEIVIICDSPKDQASDIKIIPRAHSQKITSVNLNKNWGHPNKLLVTVGEDKLVKLWDVEILEKKLSHSVHRSHSKISGATFAGDERIISVSEEGVIVVWNLGLNQTTILKDVFGFKVTVTCISTCPHANWLTAFGLKNGLVVVTDLRKQGKVLYKLRGHDKSVISLAWCPAPLNIFPKDPHNYVGAKKIAQDTEDATEKFSAQKPFVTNDKPVDKQLELGNIEGNTQTTTEELREIEKNNITDEIEACGSRENTSRNIEELNKTDEKVEEFDGASTSKNEHEAKKDICVDKKKSDSNVPKDEEKNRAHPLLRIYDSEDDFLKECQKLLGNTSPENIYGTVSDKAKIENGKVGYNKDKTEVCPDIQILKESIAVEKQMSEGDKEMDIDTLESTENTLESSLFVEVGSVNESLIEEKAMSDIVNDSNYETSNGTVREIPRNVSVEEQPRKEFLLASSAKEGNIYIWRAGTDGRMQTFFSAPNKSGNRRSKTHSDKLWITLCWPSPTMLLSSSKLGELLQWTLPKPKDKSKLFRVIHKDHSSLLFSIAGPVTILNEQDWTNVDEKKLNVWTVGQDRLLLNTSLSSERTNLACYPTVGAVECFASSPLDPSRLAIGTGEGIIKIWDLSRPHVKNVLMSNFYQKIQSKVVALAWHPTNELLLAYGTLEGRIGYFDVSNKSKSPVLLPNFFKSQIHKIEWGPLNGDVENLGLFAVAEGKLITFNVKKSANDPQEVDTPDNTFVYTFSWKPDYQILLVSSKTGTLIVYSSDLKILATHYLQRKIQTICWHPDATQSDPSVTKYCNWFASVYNSKEILVYDFGIETDNSEDRIVAKYKCRDMINSHAWSPFEPTQLVVACDDGTTEIWDASSSTVLSTYINAHFESVLAVTWSPIDSDYVIIAGKDHTIRIWKVSDCPPRTNEEIVALKKKCVKEVSEDADLVPKKEKASSEEATKVKKTNKNNLLPNFYSPKDNSEIVADLHKLLSWKENSQSNEPQVDQDSSILKIFGSSADMLKIIQTNEASHKARGKYNLRSTLSLFRGDISTTIKEAIDEKRVNPWIIMMAPMVSPKLWKTACQVYAQQLAQESDSDPLEVATYLLACHQLEEAVNVLCEAALFREALALAKSRLPETDPMVTKIIEKWASYSLSVGNFETAAQCNVFLGKYEEAASVLFRRSDVEILRFATELAEKSGNEELHKAVLFRYNAFKGEQKEGKENGDLPNKVEVMLQKEGNGVENTEDNGVKKNYEANVVKSETDVKENGELSRKNGVLKEENLEVNGDLNDERKENILECEINEKNGDLASKIEVMLKEKENREKSDEQNVTNNSDLIEKIQSERLQGTIEETKIEGVDRMTTSLDVEKLESDGREAKARRSSLTDNFRLFVEDEKQPLAENQSQSGNHEGLQNTDVVIC